jgi:DoxX-like family
MKKHKIIFWTTTTFLFLFEGLMPLSTLLFMQQYITAGTKPLGYPDYFAVSLIIAKVLGATALLVTRLPRRVREWAYAGLTFNMLFAVISHLCVDGPQFVSFFPLIILAVLATSYVTNNILYNHGQDRLRDH